LIASNKKVPLMSVLITCYNRKEFILSALESVLDQTMDRSTYEIIVSKNYKDTDIDKFLIQNHCELIYDERSGIGLRLAGLISAAKSDILVFLEDDDYFIRNKLEEILNIFENPDVNYVNNAFLTARYNGAYLSKIPKHIGKNAWKVQTPASNFYILRKLFNKKAFFSMSNISIRRSVISKYINELSKIKVTPDFFTFITALQINGNLLYYQIPLTVWRFHGSTSVASGTRYEFLRKRMVFWLSVTSDLELLSSVVKSESLKKLIYSIYSEAITHNMVLDKRGRDRFDIIFRAAKTFTIMRNRHFFIIFLLALVGCISPVKTALIYSAYLLSKAPSI
jgi:glycosyltransferase involved in cell wall biosynthesis